MYMSQPGTLTEAIWVVGQLESAHKACKMSPHSGKLNSLNAIVNLTADENITAKIR